MFSEIITKVTEFDSYLTILTFTLAIVIYSIFVWKLYRFISKRDLLRLNLTQYNKSGHPVARKILGAILYFIEYLIIIPVVVFIGFAVLSIFFIIFSENQTVGEMLLIAAAIMASIRLTSYFSENLSHDLAKLFPFTILAILLLNPTFSKDLLLERMGTIPQILPEIFVYLLFVMIIEAVMRLLFLTTYQAWQERK
jgi:hypothetical protein